MTVISIIVVFGIMDKYYTADVSILPPAGSGALQGRLNTIASIVGMGSSGSNFVTLEMFESVIHSRKLEKELLNTEFEIPDNGTVKRIVLLNYLDVEGTDQREIYENAYKELDEDVIYTETDDISNLLIVSVSLKNPFLAALVANKIVKYLDKIVQEHVTKEFHEQYNYIKKRKVSVSDSIKTIENNLKTFLEKSIDITNPSEYIQRLRLERTLTIQSTIYAELKKQEELFIMQNIYMLSPVKVLDYAQIPYKKSRPKRILVLIAFLMIGGAIQLMVNATIIFSQKFRLALDHDLKSGSSK